jgi:hypothetical protein
MENSEGIDTNEQSTKSLLDKRLEICRKCPFYNALTTSCLACGCNLLVKGKLIDATCPVGHW